MYVCSCNGLTDSQVADAICSGAGCPDDIYAACGCRMQCGGCAAMMERFLDAGASAMASLSSGRNPVTV